MKKIDCSIIFIGMTCSGKSTLADALSKVIPFKKASFGGYLVNRAKNEGIDTKKNNLQILGQGLIESDYKTFLSAVIEFSNAGKNVIFEGVRHVVIHDEIKSITTKTLSFFIDTPFESRFERFNIREAEKLTKQQFLILDTHPVEKEIEMLKKCCDVILDGRKNVSTLLAEVVKNIAI